MRQSLRSMAMRTMEALAYYTLRDGVEQLSLGGHICTKQY